MVLSILYLSCDDASVFDFIGYSLESSLGDCTIKNFISDNEKDAVDILEFNNINLIVADMNIDSIYSFEFYDKLHLDVKFNDIPFVFLSSNEEDQEISILKGLSNFFLKPLDVDQLLKTLHNILDNTKSNKTQNLDYELDYDDMDDNSEKIELLNQILEDSKTIESKILENETTKIVELSKKIQDNTTQLLQINTSSYFY
ncbi:MAG: hypothetical protein U9N59_09240 [Campylobacterota bacterium]|nr:hypothetical protein [Campylobacterota bacterium]